MSADTDFGVVADTDELTVRFERRLPGPIERVWAFLTDPAKRAKWLAGGPMEPRAGGAMELIWRNDELSAVEETRPARFTQDEYRMAGQVTRWDPPRELGFTWSDGSEVVFDLAPDGDQVRLTLSHRRLSSRQELQDVAGGWHIHLDILGDVLADRPVRPFWANWLALEAEYKTRTPA